MKKLVSLVFVLCMMLGSVPAFAQDATMDNWLRYDSFWVEKNGDTYIITGIADVIDTDEITLPEKLHGWVYDKNNERDYLFYESYTIAPEAFKGCTSVRKIEFEKGIEIIPRRLCDGMSYLEEVVLPESVYAIDNEAFKGCGNLKTIDLSKVTNIGRSAFEGCKSLKDVTLSEKLANIEAYTFYGCESLENVTGLHDGIQIGQDAFKGTKIDLNKTESTENDEYSEAIRVLSVLGVLDGYENGDFKTDEYLTRAEAVEIVVKLLKLDEEAEQAETAFYDVPKKHWASGYINAAVENGIIYGMGDGNFCPDVSVTYCQMIKMLVAATGWEPVAISYGGWNNGGYLMAAQEAGIIEKTPEKIYVRVTRGEAAQLCYNAITVNLKSRISGQKITDETILSAYWEIEDISAIE